MAKGHSSVGMWVTGDVCVQESQEWGLGCSRHKMGRRTDQRLLSPHYHIPAWSSDDSDNAEFEADLPGQYEHICVKVGG